MATCANCSADALYSYEVAPSYTIPYCQRHLPRFLYSLRNSGALAVPEPEVVDEPVVDTTKKTKKTSDTPVDTSSAAS